MPSRSSTRRYVLHPPHPFVRIHLYFHSQISAFKTLQKSKIFLLLPLKKEKKKKSEIVLSSSRPEPFLILLTNFPTVGLYVFYVTNTKDMAKEAQCINFFAYLECLPSRQYLPVLTDDQSSRYHSSGKLGMGTEVSTALLGTSF